MIETGKRRREQRGCWEKSDIIMSEIVTKKKVRE